MRGSTQNSKLRTQNYFWPLLIMALGLIALLQALAVFPPAVADLIGRAWPVVLVLVGLILILDQIPLLRRWAAPLGLLVTVGLLAVIIVVAYTTRASTEREDNVVTVEQIITEEPERLRVTVETIQTRVDISPVVGEEPAIRAEFVGSTESEIETDYTLEGDSAVFLLRETRPNPIPALEAIGRGRLNVELPSGIPIELSFRNADGTVSLNLLGLNMARLNVNITRGDLLLSLANTPLEERGDVVVTRGDVTVFVPDGLAVHLFLNRGGSGREPEFPADQYLYLRDDSLQTVDFNDYEVRTELNLTVPGGIIHVE